MTLALASKSDQAEFNSLSTREAAPRLKLETIGTDCSIGDGRGRAERLGYTADELDAIPEAAVDSFTGVGYCFDAAALRHGDHVVDLGCGTGTDSFVAATKVGSEGRVVGIDIKEELLQKANELRTAREFFHVEFFKADADDAGLPSESFDAIISNGLVNLAADTKRVFREAARLLKPGGRLALSDIVTDFRPPEGVNLNATLWTAGIGGALHIDEYVDAIEAAGFQIVEIYPNPQSQSATGTDAHSPHGHGTRSITVEAVKLPVS